MSFSHTVGGKSLTHAKQRNRGQNHEKRASNRTKDSPLSSTKSSGTVQGRGKRNSTGEQPGSNVGDYARSSPQRTAGTTITKPHSQQTSNIVTLSDLENKQSKPQTSVNSKPALIKNNKPTPIASPPGPRPRPTPGRKLGIGGNLNSDLHTATTGGRGGNKAISQNKPVRSENSDHVYSRTSASNSKSNQPNNVNRTSNRTSNKPIDSVLLNNRTSQSQQSSGRGRGSRAARGTGSTRGGMAYDGRYTSSSLYSANPRPVGQSQRRSEDEDSSQQRQGEAGPSQGSSQPQQQGESPSSYRVIQPSASKRQQLLNKSTQELKALEDYRASKKPITIHGEARSTGGSMSEEEARRALEREHRNKKYDQILKRDQQRREWREKEEKEYEEKKARARRTAEENERRRQERADNFLKDEHAKTNEYFLRRLEAGMIPPQNNTSISQSPELQQLREMFPQKKLSKLQELLDMTNNDVGKVIDLLMD